MAPTARLYTAVLLVGAWLGLLLFGVALGGAVHLILLLALALAPWTDMLGEQAPVPPFDRRLSVEDDAPDPPGPDGAGDRP